MAGRGDGLAPLGSGPRGLALWIEFSRRSPEKFREGICEAKWETFGAGSGGITVASIFKAAMDTGWKPPAVGRKTVRGGGPGGGPTAGRGPAPAPGLDRAAARAEIEVTTRRHEVVAASVRAPAADPDLYRRGELLVTVAQEDDDTAKLTDATTLRRLAGSPRIIVLAEAVVGCYLTRNVEFYIMQERRGQEPGAVEVRPPEWLIRAVAHQKHWPGIRPLLAVAECPFPRPDGSIVESPGYDPDTGTVYRPSTAFLPVPDRPMQEEAKAAAERLMRPLRQYPLATEADWAVALAATLTAVAPPRSTGRCPGSSSSGTAPGSARGCSSTWSGSSRRVGPCRPRTTPPRPRRRPRSTRRGYHLNSRTHWRKRRMKKSAAPAKEPSTAKPVRKPKLTVGQMRRIMRRAIEGSERAKARVDEVLDVEGPYRDSLLEALGDPAGMLLRKLAWRCSGGCEVTAKFVLAAAERQCRELAPPGASALERTLAVRVSICNLGALAAELALNRAMGVESRISELESYETSLDRAQRRLSNAVRSLTALRRPAGPALALQINLGATQQPSAPVIEAIGSVIPTTPAAIEPPAIEPPAPPAEESKTPGSKPPGRRRRV